MYMPCTKYEGRVVDGETIILPCTNITSPAKYVRIKIPGTSERLTLCEVGVKGRRGRRVFEKNSRLFLFTFD